MKRILMIDYLGNCNQKGKPSGHPVKVLKEYTQLLGSDFDITVAAPSCLLSESKIQNEIVLPYCYMTGSVSRVSVKILQIAKRLLNLLYVKNKFKEFDIIWFYHIDYIFFLFFYFSKKDCYKIACSVFRDSFKADKHLQRTKNYLFKKVNEKLFLLIYTNENFKFCGYRSLYIPDYYYKEDIYCKYKNDNKKEKIVCLGVINRDKMIKELVMNFYNINYKLEIIGEFQDDLLFTELENRHGMMTQIENRYLSNEEYYRKLGEAKYVILPYDMHGYKGRTSGVLQESVFLGTIPIAPKELLKTNGIPGIGYDVLEDLSKYNFETIEEKRFYVLFEKLCKEKFDFYKIRDRLLKVFNSVQ